MIDREERFEPATGPAAGAALVEYVTTPGCRDCRRFEKLRGRIQPDYPDARWLEVPATSERGIALSIDRGALRFPVIVLNDEIVAVESITEDQMRAALEVVTAR